MDHPKDGRVRAFEGSWRQSSESLRLNRPGVHIVNDVHIPGAHAGCLQRQPITLIAGAHTMLSTPNFFRLEIAYSELEVYQQVMEPVFDVRNGFFYVSNRPGLGHELRQDYLEKAIPF